MMTDEEKKKLGIYDWKEECQDEEIAELCLQCCHRDTIRKLMGIPFCHESRTTCARQHGKTKCRDMKKPQPTQLELF